MLIQEAKMDNDNNTQLTLPNGSNLDVLIDAYAQGNDLHASYTPGVFRSFYWGIAKIFGSDAKNSKKKYLAECRIEDEKIAVELKRKEEEEETKQRQDNRAEMGRLVQELSTEVDGLEREYDRMADVCATAEDEKRELELRLKTSYTLDMTELGFEEPVSLATEEIGDYIRGFRDQRIALRSHNQGKCLPDGDESEDLVMDEELVADYLKNSTILLNQLEAELKRRQMDAIKLKTLPAKLEAAEQQRSFVYDSLLALTDRKVRLEAALDVVKMGIDAPELIVSGTEKTEEISEKIDAMRRDYQEQQQKLQDALLRLNVESPRQLENLTRDTKLIIDSTQEVQRALEKK